MLHWGQGVKVLAFWLPPSLPEDISVSIGAVRTADQESIQPGRAASHHSLWGLEAVEMQAKTQESGQFRLPLCITSFHQICCCFLWYWYTERWVQACGLVWSQLQDHWFLCSKAWSTKGFLEYTRTENNRAFTENDFVWKNVRQQPEHTSLFCGQIRLIVLCILSKGRCIMYGFVSPQKGGEVNLQRTGQNDWLRGWPAALC